MRRRVEYIVTRMFYIVIMIRIELVNEVTNMVSVIINWLYIAFTTLVIGHFCLKRAYRFAGYEGEIRVSASIAAGLALTTVYAGYFSIIYKVGVLANIIMIICCAVFVWLDKEDYSYLLKQYTTDCMNSLNTPAAKVKVVFAIIIFVSVLYYTTDGQFFSDSGYYHEQSIRWI